MYIDGQWVDGITTIPVTDPSDGSVIAEVAVPGPEQCEAAVAPARPRRCRLGKDRATCSL